MSSVTDVSSTGNAVQIIAEAGKRRREDQSSAILDTRVEVSAQVAISAVSGSAVAAAPKLPKVVSFSSDCVDGGSGKEYRGSPQKAMRTAETFDGEFKDYRTQDKIVGLFTNQLAQDLWTGYPARYGDGEYGKELYISESRSIVTIAATFNHVFNEAIEEVLRTYNTDAGIPYINKHLGSVLEKCFKTEIEEALNPAYVSGHDPVVLQMCFPLIEEILKKPSAIRMIEGCFFDEWLKNQTKSGEFKLF
ncbi:MAG: hypothetical protein NTX49_04580 [Chlamydiae bacterium]|nr:hypothetical protein [Chlamydiota bacterium]